MTATTFLALDLGAESGRAMSGSFDGTRLAVEEIYRFPNRPVQVHDGLHWDVLALYAGILDGLAAQVARSGPSLRGVGIDAWGVDFALLAADDTLAGLPYHYRDRRTRGMLQAALQRLSREEIFSYTGVQFMELNTLYQLLAMRRSGAPALNYATTLLLMPDLFNFWLCGHKASEWTIASTSQMCDPRTHRWSVPLLQALDLPTSLLQNISGLWLVQECRRIWLRAGRNWSYAALTELAQAAPAFRALIDPNHPAFVAPDDMPAAIRERCRATGQPAPEREGEVVRCALESLALTYRKTFEELAEVLGRPVDAVHIAGGGSQNRLLCQFTADALGLPVLAGPVEATALGNLLVQMRSAGLVQSLAEMREIVRRSVALERFEPREHAAWDEAYGRFRELLGA